MVIPVITWIYLAFDKHRQTLRSMARAMTQAFDLATKSGPNRPAPELAKATFALKDLPKEQLMEAWFNAVYLCLFKQQNSRRVLTLEVQYN